MKRKVLSILLSTALCLSMMACGPRESPPELPPGEEPVTIDDIDEVVEDDEAEVDMEDEGRGDYISNCPIVTVSTHQTDLRDDNDLWIIGARYDEIDVFSAMYDVDKINESLAKACSDDEQAVNEEYENLSKLYDEKPEKYSQMEGNENSPLMSAVVNYRLGRVDPYIISLLRTGVLDNGSDGREYGMLGMTYSVETGEMLQLSDIIVEDMDAFGKYATDVALEQLVDMEAQGAVLLNGFDAIVENITDYEWYLNATGLTFVFNPGVLMPNEFGVGEITIPYEDLTSFLDGMFLPGYEDGILAMQPGKEAMTTTIDGMMASFTCDQDTDSGKYTSIIHVDNTNTIITEDGIITGASLFKRQEKIYMFVNYYIGERINFSVYDITDGNINEIYGQSDVGYIVRSLNQETVDVCGKMDLSDKETLSIQQIIPDI